MFRSERLRKQLMAINTYYTDELIYLRENGRTVRQANPRCPPILGRTPLILM